MSMDTSTDEAKDYHELKLSTSLPGSDSIRDVAIQDDDVVVTLEERGLVAIWQRTEGNQFTKVEGWAPDARLHEKGFVFCVEAIKDAVEYPPNSFVSAGADKTARAFSLAGVERVPLIGHTNCVNSVSVTSEGLIVTGAWDGTAKVWKQGQAVLTLTGHEHAVEVLGLATGEIVTGGAGKSIIIFNKDGSVLKNIPQAHDHAIRKLIVHPLGFASCGNDGFIRVWSSRGDKLLEIASHVNAEPKFVYGVTLLPDGSFAACGEDATVRVWSPDGASLLQTLTHPAPVRAVKTLPNGDLFTACTDKHARIFTRDASRHASDEELADFDNYVQMTMASGMKELDTSTLPDESVLLKPGSKDGEVKVVNVAGKAMVYKWGAGQMVWEAVGEAVGKKEKARVNGVEYDHVTDVFVTADRCVQLGFNKDDDPDDVANAFCGLYSLPPYLRTQIVQHMRPMCDPNLCAMRKANEARLQEVTALVHVPSWATGGFQMESDLKVAAFQSKILEFSAEFQAAGSALALSGAEQIALGRLVQTLEDKANYHKSALLEEEVDLVKALLRWPNAKILPVLDGVRALMCHSDACVRLGDDAGVRAAVLAHAVEGRATHKALALKTFTNWLAKRARPAAERQGVIPAELTQFIGDVLERLAGASDPAGSANLRKAYTMFAYNFVVWFGRCHPSDSDLYVVVATGLTSLLQGPGLKDGTIFYALLTLATLGHVNQVAKEVVVDAYSTQLAEVLRAAKASANAAVGEVAEDCVRVFTLAI